jgi:hypothetical protein
MVQVRSRTSIRTSVDPVTRSAANSWGVKLLALNVRYDKLAGGMRSGLLERVHSSVCIAR